MPRGTLLTDFKRGQIDAFHQSGCTARQIARRMNRSHNVILNYLTDHDGYGTRHAGGKPKALSDRAQRKILRLASNATHSVKKIKALAQV